ncbi:MULTISPECIES: SOS response-associated peptidase [Bosea]|jgi:putative SOS response-associated peptidase YedK|uniref:Abasic site processing protein n=1 Tax=Bosea robiniae TaxID=1036780 RepID=A0ABY0P8R9_9HYPH|nr:MULTISPECIES: SOS response-associated peptidase [Bosea]TQI77256.1 putative SOS response-associated peptidase YedK [Bosea sp. AK1]SDH67113.1 Putative SOS response-associated peptidase YedK [Bosea robiniae]
MCGRFSQAYTWGEIYAFSQPLTEPESPARNLQARYNIAATTTIDILVKTNVGRELWKARWGLIPPWHKGTAKQIKPHINSRVEGIDTNSLFKRAYVKNRCIIPASGFYEWTGEEKNKTPHFISPRDGAILAFAGIWERWRDENGEEIISASIITRDANDWMLKIHTRMPAMLHPDDFEAWLDGSAGKDVLVRSSPELQEWVVDRRMNKSGAGDDDPATAAPIELEAAAPSASLPVQGTLF